VFASHLIGRLDMFSSLKGVPLEVVSSYKAAGILPVHVRDGDLLKSWFVLGRDAKRRVGFFSS
jgi:hypothetical protein